MAQTTHDTEHAAAAVQGHAGHGHDAHPHPSEKQYWIIFATLVVLTAIEVAWSFIGVEGIALVAPLVIMMTIKFVIVAGGFMHLYFDLKILNGRLFTWAFFGAILLAMAVYLVVVASFRFHV